jgi:nitrogen fixation/metabolism regulation signal transduction histidine kinase
MSRLSLRTRLLIAFGLVSVPPLLLLAASASELVARGSRETAARRLESGLATTRERLDLMAHDAEAKVGAIAVEDLRTLRPLEEGDRGLADVLALRRGLGALEIVDATNRVVSSHHWPAGFGLPALDSGYEGDAVLRVATVADGYGTAERLALMPARRATWRAAQVTVRGGPFLDAAFFADLSRVMGAEVGLRDLPRRRWITGSASPLQGWADPTFGGLAAAGETEIGTTRYRFAARPLRPSLWLVVAMPWSPLDVVAGQVLRLTLLVSAFALASALLAALWLSGRIAEPVAQLSAGARRVSNGDLESSVEVATRDEIGELAQAFNTMTADLRSSRVRLLQIERVAAWREMARRLAHELKNPIFPIQLSIETLRRAHDQGKDVGPLFREASDTILDELRALKKIIDEFSEFARMPQPQLQATDVSAVLRQVLSLYDARAEGVRVERELAQGLPPVAADPDLLARAVSNLVANGLEAMPDGGTLSVRARPTPGAVVVEVQDTGPGLTEEQKTRLFTPYFTTKKSGTGLGLAIVQGIVADHGGRVEVTSEPGGGTCFTLYLPLVREMLPPAS